MKTKIHFAFLLVLVFIGFQTCDHSKTVIIDKKPQFIGENIPLTELPNEVNQEVIRIGELNKVENLDPLFASNNGELRILNLVYESLVSLDNQGNIRPGIANSWKISPDSLVYEFYLGDKHFHDSDLFLNGLGRSILADDIRFVFERMAQAQVPPATARLFWAIRGLDSYFHEQHEIYYAQKRSLSTITGIETPDSKTVIFRLDYKDASFLKKLTKPQISIYPKESVASTSISISNWPIGSNKWKFSGLFRDSIITLKPVNQSTNLTTEIKRKRIEFYFFASEVALYKKFFLNEIDVVPELGPQLSKAILKQDGTINEVYKEQFSLFNSVSTEPYFIFFNPRNRFGVQFDDANYLLLKSNLKESATDSPIFERIIFSNPQSNKTDLKSIQVFAKGQTPPVRLSLAFNNDPIALELMRLFYHSISDNFDVVLLNSPISGRETVYYVRTSNSTSIDGKLLAQIFVKRSGLQKSDKVYAEFSSEPWWLHIDTK